MVTSLVLGVVAGTGLGLVIVVTIIVYHFYAIKYRNKSPLKTLYRSPNSLISTNSTGIHRDETSQTHQQHYQSVSPSHAALNVGGQSSFNLSQTSSWSWTLKPRDIVAERFKNKNSQQQRYCTVQPTVPDKFSEVFGDVLELACGGGGGGSGSGETGSAATSSKSTKIGMVTGVAIIRGRWAQRATKSTLLSSLVTGDSADKNTNCTSNPQDFSGAKDIDSGQSAARSSMVGEPGGTAVHQSRKYAGNAGASGTGGTGAGGRVFARNPSISSQGSLEGASSGASIHGGSSPQIRAFGPDGRDAVGAASSYPPSRSSRSPSPARAASLDARCASPANCAGNIHSGTTSPCQSSNSWLATGAASSYGPGSVGAARPGLRCLSPLLIPSPRGASGSDGGGPAPPASPLGSLQPDLYQRRDGPLFLSARRTGKSLGRLHLRLKYDFDRSDLHVHLIEAHDLAGSDQGGFNDPYVKITLSPEVDARKRQTAIHTNDPNPFFDQHFKFPVSHEQLQEKTLLLQVLDYDRFSRNDVVGSVRVDMEQLELVSSTCSLEVWGEIEREKKPPEEIQEVMLSLSYLPSAERLTVLILEARNLFPPQDKETLDPFVKVSLLTGDKRVKKKKTAVRKATRCPVWNEAMSFNVAARALAASAIEVCVLDSSSELIGGNAIVGSCIVGPATSGGTPSNVPPEAGNRSREHWLHMTHSSRKAIAMWHTLH